MLLTPQERAEARAQKLKAAIEKARALYMLLDTDGSNSLEVDQLVEGAAILGLPRTEAEALFYELDADGNGSLDQEE